MQLCPLCQFQPAGIAKIVILTFYIIAAKYQENSNRLIAIIVHQTSGLHYLCLVWFPGHTGSLPAPHRKSPCPHRSLPAHTGSITAFTYRHNGMETPVWAGRLPVWAVWYLANVCKLLKYALLLLIHKLSLWSCVYMHCLYIKDFKNIKNVRWCRDGMPKSMQTR